MGLSSHATWQIAIVGGFFLVTMGGVSRTASPAAAPAGVDRYVETFEGVLPRRWKGHLLPQLEWCFDGLDLAGKSMLDVGAGRGQHSLYAAVQGATVLALEPELEGSTSRPADTLLRLRGELGLDDRVTLRSERLQELDAGGQRFDVVALLASINHLDEEACIHLLDDPAAVRTYNGLFDKLYELTAPGGTILISDASRHNFWGTTLHVKNPVARQIEWHKHQTPETWTLLLLGAGFCNPDVRWTTLGPLRHARAVLANRTASFFLQSYFQLRAQRPAE
jgi:2-polyprenyl-3-methyl-5-hydroxy-6-metoxy-1,4-benzoquinol methylase